jgi:arylsulfatase A-like enzyme
MATSRPNILVLFRDDIGWWNISYINQGGWRVPAFVRWPGRNAQRFRQSLALAADAPCRSGEPAIKEKLLDGDKAAGRTFNVHIYGYNMLPYLSGETKECKSFGMESAG